MLLIDHCERIGNLLTSKPIAGVNAVGYCDGNVGLFVWWLGPPRNIAANKAFDRSGGRR